MGRKWIDLPWIQFKDWALGKLTSGGSGAQFSCPEEIPPLLALKNESGSSRKMVPACLSCEEDADGNLSLNVMAQLKTGTQKVGAVWGPVAEGQGHGTDYPPILIAGEYPGDLVGILQLDANKFLKTVLQAGTAEIGKLGAGTAEIGKLGAGTAEIGQLVPRAVTADELQVSTSVGTDTIAAPSAGNHIEVLGVAMALGQDAPTVGSARQYLSHNLGSLSCAVGGDFALANNWDLGPNGYVALPTATALTLTNSTFSAGSIYGFYCVRYRVRPD